MSRKVVFATESTATGDRRDGHVTSSDGHIDPHPLAPRELGGTGDPTDTEQLFFPGALRAARRSVVALGDVDFDVSAKV